MNERKKKILISQGILSGIAFVIALLSCIPYVEMFFCSILLFIIFSIFMIIAKTTVHNLIIPDIVYVLTLCIGAMLNSNGILNPGFFIDEGLLDIIFSVLGIVLLQFIFVFFVFVFKMIYYSSEAKKVSTPQVQTPLPPVSGREQSVPADRPPTAVNTAVEHSDLNMIFTYIVTPLALVFFFCSTYFLMKTKYRSDDWAVGYWITCIYSVVIIITHISPKIPVSKIYFIFCVITGNAITLTMLGFTVDMVMHNDFYWTLIFFIGVSLIILNSRAHTLWKNMKRLKSDTTKDSDITVGF